MPLAEQVNTVQTYIISDMELEKVKTSMPKALAKVDKEFADIWEQMVEYGVYDFEALPGKQSGVAFTTELYDYDTPFIYSYWEEDFYSTTTLMHEFGHFIDMWKRYDDTVVFNLDIAETYSQGLELLMEPHFKTFTRYAQEAQEAHLQNFMNPLTYQAMLEEFQQELYKMEELSADSISLLYGQMLVEYDLADTDSLLGEDGRDYSWFSVTHLFDSPFYTISYWTSACVALQIWAVSRDDYDAAVQLYQDLMDADQNQPFTQLVTGAGLKDPGDRNTLLDIADNFIDFYGLESSAAA